MQLGIEKDLRPIGQDLVSILQDLHKQELDKKDLIICRLLDENEHLKKRLGER